MVEHLRDAELVLGLVEKFLIFLGIDRDDLEGVLLAVARAADVQNVAVRPVPRLPRI